MPTRVKICGLTRPEDALRAAEYGADAIGLNFFAGPRKITLDRAADILSMIPPLVTPVALTSGPTSEFPDAPTIEEIQSGPATAGRAPIRISTIQYYGKTLFLEDNKDPRFLFTQIWSVCRIQSGDIASQIAAHLSSLSFRPGTLVIDAAAPGQIGGTGNKLDWEQLADALYLCFQKEAFSHLILAGGLTPDNVAEAIRIVRPYAVDVSSGVEVAGKPGIKDPQKMLDFIQTAKSASTKYSVRLNPTS